VHELITISSPIGLFHLVCSFQITESSRAIISGALPNEGTYDVEYETGEQGRSLELSCLRRLVTDELYYDDEDDKE
jgi:hypothetical protein